MKRSSFCVKSFLICLKCAVLLLLLVFDANAQSPSLVYPEIKGYGGVVKLHDAVMPELAAKALIDITDDGKTKNGVNSGLNAVARLINLYALAGYSPSELDIHVIIHGRATKIVLSSKNFEEKFNEENLNIELINQLKQKGVNFMVCGQAYIRSGYHPEQMTPQVQSALSALTTLTLYQQKGYAIINL